MFSFLWWKAVGAIHELPLHAGKEERVKSEKPNRRSLRLKGYDYAQAGGYFVTICTHLRECLFGEIWEGKVVLNEFGKIIEDEWYKTKQMRQGIALDAFIVMPNHIHCILILEGKPYARNRRGTMHRAPTPRLEQFGRPTANSIPTILRGIKSSVTLRINVIRGTPRQPVWQRNYYEHVIRNDIDLEEIREYIQNNPVKWLEDENHPANIKKSQP